MARSYANIFCAIWDDPEFCALTSNGQRTYFMLVTQGDISACGILPLRMRRWQRLVAEHDRSILDGGLDELAAASFILTDHDYEELLVRTFVKHDGGYKHSMRLKAVVGHAEAVKSECLRAALAIELHKLGIESALKVRRVSVKSPTQVPPESHSSPTQEAIESGRSVVTTYVSTESTLHKPESGNHTPAAIERQETTAQAIIGRWIEHCRARPPSRVIGQVSKHVKDLIDEGIDPRAVERGVAQWATKGLNPSVLPSVVNEVMNASPSGKRPTTDQRALDAMALAERLKAAGE